MSVIIDVNLKIDLSSKAQIDNYHSLLLAIGGHVTAQYMTVDATPQILERALAPTPEPVVTEQPKRRNRTATKSEAPAEAAPAEAAPAEPAPAEAAPAEPAPVEAAPAEPAPVEAAPVEPAPVEPAPVEPAPVEAAPAEAAPAEAAPAEADGLTAEDLRAHVTALMGSTDGPTRVKALKDYLSASFGTFNADNLTPGQRLLGSEWIASTYGVINPNA